MVCVPINVNGMRSHRAGTVVGKALEPSETGRGDTLALLSGSDRLSGQASDLLRLGGGRRSGVPI